MIDRSVPPLPTIRPSERLAGRMASMAAGRVLVIGYIRSWRCGVVVGDLATSWRRIPPGAAFVEVTPVEAVSVHVDRRLLDVLVKGGAELWPGGPFRRGTPTVRLQEPACWIDFLDGPVAMSPAIER